MLKRLNRVIATTGRIARIAQPRDVVNRNYDIKDMLACAGYIGRGRLIPSAI